MGKGGYAPDGGEKKKKGKTLIKGREFQKKIGWESWAKEKRTEISIQLPGIKGEREERITKGIKAKRKGR